MTVLALNFPEVPDPRRPASAAPGTLDRADASAFLRDCASQGIVFGTDGDHLLVQASTPLTPELRTRILALKPALLEQLRTYACTRCAGTTRFPAPTVCWWCRQDAPSAPAAG